MHLIQVNSYPNRAECGVCCVPLNEPQAENDQVVAHYDTRSTLLRKIQLIVNPKFIHHVHRNCAENWRILREEQQQEFTCPGGCVVPLENQPPLPEPRFVRRCWTQLSLISLNSLLDKQNCIVLTEGAAALGIHFFGYELPVDLLGLFLLGGGLIKCIKFCENNRIRFNAGEFHDQRCENLFLRVLSGVMISVHLGFIYKCYNNTPPLIIPFSTIVNNRLTGVIGGIAGIRLTHAILPRADAVKFSAGMFAGVVGGLFFSSVMKTGRLYASTMLFVSSAANFVRAKFHLI